MTNGAKERRAARHAAEKAARKATKAIISDKRIAAITDTLSARPPRLTWISVRTRKNSGLGSRGISGHLTEHAAALKENQ